MKVASRNKKRFSASRGHVHVALLLTTVLVGCETLTPIVTEVARNLLSTAAHNYSPRYAETLEQLVITLVTEGRDTATQTAEASPEIASIGSDQAAIMQPVSGRALASEQSISLEVAILAQRMTAAGRMQPTPIEDGATLRDGGDDPAAGDTLKIAFTANCDCYIYIIAIDGSGYVELAYPGPTMGLSNPVQRQRQYLLPEGNVWYGLDRVRGVETIYVVASHSRRTDLERAIDQLAKTERRSGTAYRPVTQPAIIPQTRGMVKVDLGAPMTVPAESGASYQVTPNSFTSAIAGADFVITRWFYHVSNEGI